MNSDIKLNNRRKQKKFCKYLMEMFSYCDPNYSTNKDYIKLSEFYNHGSVVFHVCINERLISKQRWLLYMEEKILELENSKNYIRKIKLDKVINKVKNENKKRIRK